MQFAAQLVNRMIGVSSSCKPTTARAVLSGRATAIYFGTSSPKTVDTDVTITNTK